MAVRASLFVKDIAESSKPLCVSYTNFEENDEQKQEEIYTSLTKVRPSNHESGRHIIMIPLGSPHQLCPDIEMASSDGTIIRIPEKYSVGRKELIPQMRQTNFNVISNPIQKMERKKDFESWSGRAMEGRVFNNGQPFRGTNNIRGYWERNIQIEKQMKAEEERHNRPKSYGFPKWRSTDALSASLVASNNIQIPSDSRIPAERMKKMEETEKEALEIKKEIHQAEMQAGSSSKSLSKGKSLDSLNMQVDYKPWYDSEKIKSAVSRESISNIATSREFFETASQRDWRSTANSRRDSMCSLNIAPPLPPKSDAIQIRQVVASSQIQPTVLNNTAIYTRNGGNLGHSSYITISNNNLQNSDIYNSDNLPSGQIQNVSLHQMLQQDSPQAVDPIEQQEVLLMLYLKQNMDIVQGLGIHIPHEILSEMNDLQSLPVELRIAEEEPHKMFSPVKNGRFQKKPIMQQTQNKKVGRHNGIQQAHHYNDNY